MTDIILINPSIYYDNEIPQVLDASFPPLGILYLASVLEKNDIDVSVIDVGACKISKSDLIRIIEKENPVVVGISSMTASLQGAVEIAKEIKNNFKNILVGLGGSHISADPGFIKRFKYFDFGIVGEGEITLTNIVKDALKNKKIKSIHYGEIVQDLDSIPFPARHLIELKDYKRKAGIIATRGCPYNCYYCSRPAISKKVRCRSAKNVVDEMQTLHKYYKGHFQFQDDTFTINRKNTIEFCEELIFRGLNAKWTVNTRIDLVDERLLKRMHDAGCHTVIFGIESANERIRNNIINKKFSNEKIKEVLSLCKKIGIDVDAFFMIGHPSESLKEINETINFTLKHDFNIVGFSITTPFPGSKLYDIAMKKKIINRDIIDRFAKGELGKGYAGIYPIHFDLIKPQKLEKIREAGFKKFYFRPKYIFNRLRKDFRSFNSLKTDLQEAIPLLLYGCSKRTPYYKICKKD